MEASLIPVHKDKKHASYGLMITLERSMDSTIN